MDAVGDAFSKREVKLLGIAALAGALLTAFGFLVATDNTPDLASLPFPEEELMSLAEDVIDELVDSGAIRPVVRYDDPLLKQQRTIIISSPINYPVAEEVVAKLLYLDALDPTTPIELYIRTNGGYGNDAHAICDVIERIDAPVNTWAIGACISAGTKILAAGSGTRRVLPHAVISIHIVQKPGSGALTYDTAYRLREERFWRSRAKFPESFYPMAHEKHYYFSAEEALQYGVVDEIYRAKQAAEKK